MKLRHINRLGADQLDSQEKVARSKRKKPRTEDTTHLEKLFYAKYGREPKDNS